MSSKDSDSGERAGAMEKVCSLVGTGTAAGSSKSAAVGGTKPVHAATATEIGVAAEPTDDGQDLEAIRDTCQYMTNVLENLNARIDSLHPEARYCIEQLNTKLSKLIIKQEPTEEKPLSSVKRKSKRMTKKKQIAQSLPRNPSDSSDESLREPVNVRKKVNFARPRKFTAPFSNYVEPDSEGTTEDGAASADYDRQQERTHSSRGAGPHVLSAEDVLQALSRLDNRSVPKPEAFDSASGQSFNQFLSTFEEYCQHTFRGSSTLWIGELGRLLKGDMSSAFEVLKVPGDSYNTLKKKLQKWRQDKRESYENDTKSRFTKAQRKPMESLRLYAARLEKSFRLAYPHRTVDASRTLRQKYFDTVPATFRKQLQTARSLSMSMNQRELSWETILTLASQQDASGEQFSCAEEPEDQVWMNYSSNYHAQPRNDWRPVTSYDLRESYETPQLTNRSRFDVWQSSSKHVPQTGQSKQSQNMGVGRANSGPHAAPRLSFSASRPSSNPRMGGNPDPRQEFTPSKKCFHCNRAGHIKSQCRRFLNQCLICGSPDHRISGCPRRRYDAPAVVNNQPNGFVNRPREFRNVSNDTVNPYSNDFRGHGGVVDRGHQERLLENANRAYVQQDQSQSTARSDNTPGSQTRQMPLN